jgi:hypothetical protein
MSEAMPKVTQLGQVQGGSLDTTKLLEAAQSKLTFARGELNKVLRERELKRVDVAENYRVKVEELKREAEDALVFIDQQTVELARPAREMIALVESMMNFKS